MAYGQVLKQSHLTRLWLSQLLSVIGDQLYAISLGWMAIKIGDSSAGYVVATGAFSSFAVALLGGVYADRWNKRKMMVSVDLLRAAIVFTLAIFAHITTLNLFQLGVASVFVSGLGAMFSPALAASLPELVRDRDGNTLQSFIAMMDLNNRMSKIIGPALASWLAILTDLPSFFTIDAVTFLVSAGAILSIGSSYKWSAERPANSVGGLAGIWKDISRGARQVYENEQLFWAILLYEGSAFAWCLVVSVGFPLWVKHLHGANLGSYGLLLSSYGIGNAGCLLVMGAVTIRRRMLLISISQMIYGIGFLIVPLAGNFALSCFGSFLAGTAGPISAVILSMMIQKEVPREDIGKVWSLRQCLMSLAAFLGLVSAPVFYNLTGPTRGMEIGAVLFLAAGLANLLKFGINR